MLRTTSLESTARQAGITRQAVIRYENMLYENLSPKLAEVFAAQRNETVDEVNRAYQLARLQHQRDARFKLEFLPNLKTPNQTDQDQDTYHPFLTWRLEVSHMNGLSPERMAFCRLLAIHPAALNNYEDGNVEGMPPLIKRALAKAIPNLNYTFELDKLGIAWFKAKQTKKVVR